MVQLAAPFEESDNHPQQGQRRQHADRQPPHLVGQKGHQVGPQDLAVDEINRSSQPGHAKHHAARRRQPVA